MAKRGRKPKLTKKMIDDLHRELKEYPVKLACPMAGVAVRTFYYWLAEAEALLIDLLNEDRDETKEPLTPHEELLLQLLRSQEVARATHMRDYYKAVRKAAEFYEEEKGAVFESANLSMRMLARLNPDEFTLPAQGAQANEQDVDEGGQNGVMEVPAPPAPAEGLSQQEAFMAMSQQQQSGVTKMIQDSGSHGGNDEQTG